MFWPYSALTLIFLLFSETELDPDFFDYEEEVNITSVTSVYIEVQMIYS